MNTQKVAITIPKKLVMEIDELSRNKGMSRSKFISIALRESLMHEKGRHVKDAYDRVFSDESLRKEQLNTANWFEKLGCEEGQEW